MGHRRNGGEGERGVRLGDGRTERGRFQTCPYGRCAGQARLTAARFGEGPCGRQGGCLLAWGHSALGGRAKRTGPSRRLREMPPRMTAGRERSPHGSGVPRRHRLWPRGPVVPADRRPAGGAGPVGDQGPEGHVQDGGSRPGERTVFLRQDDPAEGAERGAMARIGVFEEAPLQRVLERRPSTGQSLPKGGVGARPPEGGGRGATGGKAGRAEGTTPREGPGKPGLPPGPLLPACCWGSRHRACISLCLT